MTTAPPVTFGDPQEKELLPKEAALWLFERYTERGVLNIPAAFRLAPGTRLDELQTAIDVLVRRHRALRTTYPERDGTPVRHVLDPDEPGARCPLETQRVDDQSLSGALREFARRRFDLGTAVPIRAAVFQGSADGDVLCLVVQHIACDAESFGVLARELEASCAGLRDDGQVPAALLDEGHELSEPVAEVGDLDYWRRQLAGTVGASRPLRLGREAQTRTTYEGAVVATTLSSGAEHAVRTLARDLGMTANTVLLTAFSIVLAHSGAGDDVMVAVPVDVRTRGARDAVGYHVSLIPIRARLPVDDTFRATARAIRSTFLDGLGHARASMDDVLPGSYEATAEAGGPLVRHMFNYRPSGAVLDGAVLTERVPVSTGYTRLDLQVTVVERPTGLHVEALYSVDLFEPADMSALIDRIDLLLQLGAQAPDMTLGELEAMTTVGGIGDRSGPEAAARRDAVAHEPVSRPGSTDPQTVRVLVDQWRGILGDPDLGPDAHFFRNGGTSMQAAQLVARIRSALGVRISLRQVFAAPTPTALGAVIGQADGEPSTSSTGADA